MTAFTKREVGNKLFTIEWDLNPDQSGGDQGDFFEAKDCELVSIHADSSNGLEGRLRISNFNNPATHAFSLPLDGQAMLPWPPTGVDFPPQMRWYGTFVSEGVSGDHSRFSLLFREI